MFVPACWNFWEIGAELDMHACVLMQSETHVWREVKEGLSGAQLCFYRGVFLFGCGCVLVPEFLLGADDDGFVEIIEESGRDSQPFSHFAHLRFADACTTAFVILSFCHFEY